MSGIFKRLWTCIFFFAGTFSAFAQNGQFSGQVTDQHDAAVPDAQVQVLNLDTLVSLQTKTNQAGEYVVPFLQAGRYRIVVQASGFSMASQEIALAPGQAVVLNVQLTLAAERSSVKVEEVGPGKVETENAEVSGTITQKELVSIGLNGRNFTQLIALTPGVSNQTGQDEAKVGVLGSAKYSVNGGRLEYNTFEVDGSDVLNAGINKDNSTLNVYPSLDAIQEVHVLTSNYGAMYGRSASGTTIVTTKSGGRQFRGDAYEFLRNEAFNARNFFDPTTRAPLYRRQDFGFTLGGPLYIPKVYNKKKDRTYFFYSEEFRLEKTPTTFRHAVPSLAERSGDFRDVCPVAPPGGLFSRAQYPDCPAINTARPDGQQIFPSNNLTSPSIAGPQTPLSRNAVAILGSGIIPAPNATSGCNSTISSCYIATVSPSTYWREELFRIDHDITSNVRLSFRYIHDSWDTTVLSPQWAITENSFPTIQNRFVGPGADMVLRSTQILSPSLLNEIVVSYANSHITLMDVNGPSANSTRPPTLDAPCAPDLENNLRIQCPIGYLFTNNFGGKMPGIVIAGNNAAYGGAGFAVDAGYMPWDHTNPTYTLADRVSKTIGKHTLQFGGSFTLYQRNQTNGPIGAATAEVQGILTFSNLRGLRSTGNAFADFLKNIGGTATSPAAGAIATFQQDSAQLRYYQRFTVAEPYFQDDWKVTPRLTLNLGVRLSLFGTFHDKNGKTYNWLPSAFDTTLASRVAFSNLTGGLTDAATGKPIPLDLSNLDPRLVNGLVPCGTDSIPQGCMSGHLFNPAPRIGFAWDPTGSGKNSIRAGYGIFFEHGTPAEANTGSLEGGAPAVLNMTQLNPLGWACIGGVANGCPVPGAAYPLNVTGVPDKAVWPYVQQWSMSVQRELPSKMVASVAYVGGKGTHLTAQLQLNQLPPLPASQNPFGIHEPLITTGPNRFFPSLRAAGDCGGFLGASGFQLPNSVVVSLTDPAAINMMLACYGVPGSSGALPDPNSLRPYRGLGLLYSLQNVANSSYNALQATLRRTQGPLELSVAYTYSHSLDNSSDRSDATFVDSFDLRSNRASSNFDQRHLLNVSYIYQFPFYHHKVSSVLRVLMDGWSISGLTIFQSGNPFSVINGGSPTGVAVLDNAGVANGTGLGSYPDVVGSPSSAAPAGGNNAQSFGPLLGNPGAFVAPRGLTFGNAGRNFMNNPSRLNFDMAVLKNFRVLGERNVEFRAEAFNVFNHTQFRIYDPNLGNTGSNIISCYGGAKVDYSAAGGDGADCLTGSAFLHPVNAYRPRTVQLGLKFVF